MEKLKRTYPIGAEIIPHKGVDFRVWAPDHDTLELVLCRPKVKPQFYSMQREDHGYFSYFSEEAEADSEYYFKLPTSKKWLSDPASRFQPKGPYGPSCVVDPHFNWRDKNWPGITIDNQIIYEMHIGTFTKEGTFKAAALKLAELKKLGITTIEMMPIHDFPGRFGWSYDGVNLFAPHHLYGSPRDLKLFIDKAHALRLGVILDVVYNHLGPEANQLFEFTKKYINVNFSTEWGEAINFDVPESCEFFLTNARYWIEEYHFDGLRVDDTASFYPPNSFFLRNLVRVVKNNKLGRNTIVIGENQPQDTKLLESMKMGEYSFDALWNDDFHHCAVVRLLGKREAYYTDYQGMPQEFISLIKYGFLYQGQYYMWHKDNRGVANFNLPKSSTVVFLENHDQLANSLYGKHLHQISELGIFRALVTFFILSPNTLMIFQGQEYGSSAPFFYFSDHSQELNKVIKKGREKFLSQFPSLASEESCKLIKNPSDINLFKACKLDHSEKLKSTIYQLYKDLIFIRNNDAVFKKIQYLKVDGAVLGENSFLIRYFDGTEGDRLIIINFGQDQYLTPSPEPLLAAGINSKWEILWSSESPLYGGNGTPLLNTSNWKLLGHSAIVLKSEIKE